MDNFDFEIAPCYRCKSQNVRVITHKRHGSVKPVYFCKCDDCKAENSDYHPSAKIAAYWWNRLYLETCAKSETENAVRYLQSAIGEA